MTSTNTPCEVELRNAYQCIMSNPDVEACACLDPPSFLQSYSESVQVQFMSTMAFVPPFDPNFCSAVNTRLCSMESCCCDEEVATYRKCHIEKVVIPTNTPDIMDSCTIGQCSTTSEKQGGNSGLGILLPLIIGLVVIIGAIGWMFYRRRRSNSTSDLKDDNDAAINEEEEAQPRILERNSALQFWKRGSNSERDGNEQKELINNNSYEGDTSKKNGTAFGFLQMIKSCKLKFGGKDDDKDKGIKADEPDDVETGSHHSKSSSLSSSSSSLSSSPGVQRPYERDDESNRRGEQTSDKKYSRDSYSDSSYSSSSSCSSLSSFEDEPSPETQLRGSKKSAKTDNKSTAEHTTNRSSSKKPSSSAKKTLEENKRESYRSREEQQKHSKSKKHTTHSSSSNSKTSSWSKSTHHSNDENNSEVIQEKMATLEKTRADLEKKMKKYKEKVDSMKKQTQLSELERESIQAEYQKSVLRLEQVEEDRDAVAKKLRRATRESEKLQKKNSESSKRIEELEKLNESLLRKLGSKELKRSLSVGDLNGHSNSHSHSHNKRSYRTKDRSFKDISKDSSKDERKQKSSKSKIEKVAVSSGKMTVKGEDKQKKQEKLQKSHKRSKSKVDEITTDWRNESQWNQEDGMW